MTLASEHRSGGPEGEQAGDYGAGASSASGGLRAFTFDRLDPEELPDMVRAGAVPGSTLVRRNDLCLLGSGEALRIVLPAPWTSPASVALVGRALSAIPAVSAVSSTSAVPAVRPAPVGRAVPAPPAILAPPPYGEPDGGAEPPEAESRPTGPLAMGALPYDPSSSGYLVVPRFVLARRGDDAWATIVVGEGEAPPGRTTVRDWLRRLRDASAGGGAPPDGFTLTASMPHDQWTALVERTLGELARGNLAKVVLARRVDVVANRPFVLHDVLARLESLYPSCAVFRVEDFIGASPEILVRRTGDEILSHPLAGTVARSGEQSTDEALLAGLMASPKHRREHRLVVDEIAAQLRPLCSALDVPPQPSVLALRNVSHLGTRLRGRLRAPVPTATRDGGYAPANALSGTAEGAAEVPAEGWPGGGGIPTALDLAALLQPTPAVGGHPTEAAIAWQRANEGFDRGWYAGPVGWVDASGDGEWVLGLRSARVSGQSASLYAGNGIVAGSGPQAELAETQLKLQALLAALVRP